MSTDFPDLTLLSRGKVRDVYSLSSPDHLLFVATDRISAYDVVLRNVGIALSITDHLVSLIFQGIPDKGEILTRISAFWFEKMRHIIPNHLITTNIGEMPLEVQAFKDMLAGRCMLVKKAKVIPLEAIVRGYLTGVSTSTT
jgi:phosphoribosylaminoimidazole-succinocarboxamide synthase